MKVLITGGAGFIGKNLCLELLKIGHQVTVIDNFITSSKNDFKKFPGFKYLDFYEGDICNVDLIKKVGRAHKFDQIYHLACPTGVPNLTKLSFEMLMTCSLGTKNILDLAKEQKARLLFTSSSESYGDPQVFPQDESYTGNVDPVGVRSPYEEGKRFSESLVKMYCNKFRLKAKIVRVFNTYGPLMCFDDTRVIPRFYLSVLKGKPLPVKGKGEQKRTFVFVDDLIAGLILVMKKGKTGEVYNLGGEEEVKINELAKLVIKISGKKSGINFIKREDHDHKSRKPNLKKVQNLGWRSKISLEEGLRRTIESIR